MQLYNTYRLYVKKYNLSVQFLLTSAERLYSLGKPFAVLLPLAALQGRGRYRHLKNGVELLAFDRRISFYMGRKSARPSSGCAFASAYFCRGVLPEKLVLEEIRQYDRPLWEWQETVDFME